MSRSRLQSTAIAAILAATCVPTSAEEKKPPQVGAAVADFRLTDIHRRPKSLADFKDKKAFVVAFLDTECPIVNLYVPTLIELHKSYADKGVQFIGINSSGQDAFVAVAAHAQDRRIPFPVLKDFEHKTADAFGATRTPEVFLLDADRVIRYRGRIDDQYGLDFRKEKPTRSDLREAIDELLAGRAIAKPATEVAGCPIEKTKIEARKDVTYAKHVAAIMQNRCQECHRPGEVAPFSLLTYEDAQKRGKRIREALIEERMPPWHADPRYGKFLNDRRLSAYERATLLAWIDAGTPKGDDKDMPPPRTFVDGWKIGKPDQVIAMDKEFKVPATGVLTYQRFKVDTNFTDDVWIQAAEARPGNRAVVHHILVYILPPGRENPYDADGTASTLTGWAPGDMPAIFPAGMARKIPAKSRFMFEVHYTPNGTEQTDRSSVGIIFTKKPPQHAVETNILANMGLVVPPRTANHVGQMTFTFKDDALVIAFMPHMHLRGTSARYIAT
jgi:peroxiredoxin